MINRRTLARTTLAAVLFAAMPLSAVLAVNTPTPAAQTAAQTQRINTLKSKGTTEIDRRIAGLNAALAKLTDANKLSAANKDALTKTIQEQVTNLTALKAKLSADTDLATARADVQSIVTGYRVYVVTLPKARLIAAADRQAAANEKLVSLATKLQTQLTTAKSAGQDVAALQANLDDLKAKLAIATTATDGLAAKIIAVAPTDYNANHATLVTYRTSLKTAQDSLKTARNDAKAVVDGLKALK